MYSLIDNGRFGVNFFLLLSRFVMAFGHSRRLNDSNIVGAITFIKEEKTNIRKSNIELLRIIGMLMIIARHYMVNPGY